MGEELQETAFDKAFTKDHYKRLLDSIPVMTAYADANLFFAYSNKAYANLAGLPENEIIGKNLKDVFSEDEFASARPYINEALKGKKQCFYTTRQTAKDECFLEVIYVPDISGEGKVSGFTIFVKDLTQEKNNENKLLKKAIELEDYMSNASIGLHWVDENGIIKWANRMEMEMLGYEPHEFIGKNIAEFHVDPSVLEDISEKLSRNVPLRNYEARMRCKDGSIKFVHINSNVYREKGKFIHTRCFIIDITNEKMLADALRESESRFRSIASETPMLIWMTDESGNCRFMNKTFLSYLGINDKEEFTNEPWRNYIHPEDYEAALLQYENVLKNPRPYSIECRFKEGNTGDYHWFMSKGIPRYYPGGSFAGFIVTSLDIDDKKRAEDELIMTNKIAEYSLLKREKAMQELMETKKQVEEMMRVKEQFISNMSHEIRTPMNAIVGFTELIGKTPLTPEQKQYTEAIKTSGENLLVIINDILDFSKLEAGGIRFEKTDFKLSQVLATITDMLLPKSIEKKIRLSVKVGETVPDNLTGDPTRLTQILLNLVGNAVKFTEKGSVQILIEPLQKTDTEIGLKFIVSDTGIGIPEEKHKTIFEPFTQATSDTTRKYGGSGLGLSIAKQFIERQGGKITLTSTPGKGSIFEFSLTFGIGTQPPVPTVSLLDRFEHDDFLVQGLNVLLVEDNELNQLLATKVLTGWKWNVDLAENGLIALKKLEKNDYDIILMDIQLPEMDGYEATMKIRTTFKAPKCNIPIMAMTAHAMPSEERKCYEAGMDGYISKPFSVKVLYSRIVAILSSGKTAAPGLKRKLPKPVKK